MTPDEALESTTAPATPSASSPPVDSPHDPARDDVLASLGRRFRGASLRLQFALRTAATRQIFHRDFVYVSRQLHALEASRRVQGIDRQLLRDALAAIGRRADGARTLLLLCASEARALIAVHGLGEADVAFARPIALQATIVSPHARSFLELLGQADDALIQLEKAWLLGLVDPITKAREASECRRALMSFKEVVRHQRHVVGLHVREVNAARRQLSARSEPPPAEPPGGSAHAPAAFEDHDPQSPSWPANGGAGDARDTTLAPLLARQPHGPSHGTPEASGGATGASSPPRPSDDSSATAANPGLEVSRGAAAIGRIVDRSTSGACGGVTKLGHAPAANDGPPRIGDAASAASAGNDPHRFADPAANTAAPLTASCAGAGGTASGAARTVPPIDALLAGSAGANVDRPAHAGIAARNPAPDTAVGRALHGGDPTAT